MGAEHGDRLADEHDNDNVTKALLECHDADADVLEQDGKLEGHVGEDVEQDPPNRHPALYFQLRRADRLNVPAESIHDRFKVVIPSEFEVVGSLGFF